MSNDTDDDSQTYGINLRTRNTMSRKENHDCRTAFERMSKTRHTANSMIICDNRCSHNNLGKKRLGDEIKRKKRGN